MALNNLYKQKNKNKFSCQKNIKINFYSTLWYLRIYIYIVREFNLKKIEEKLRI